MPAARKESRGMGRSCGWVMTVGFEDIRSAL